MQALDRLLALVCRDLGASRAWIEYGSASPPEAVSAPIREGWRLCASVEQASAEVRSQLEELASSFDRVLLEATEAAPAPSLPSEAASTLRHTLDVLVERVGAAAAWVIDERSPIVWAASSEGVWLTDVERARTIGAALGEPDPDQVLRWTHGQQLPPPPPALVRHLPTIALAIESVPHDLLLVTWSAIAEACATPAGWSRDWGRLHVTSRPFAAIYRLLVLFDGPFSPLHAQTTLNRATPAIERLITDHPPVDPTPKGARVHAFVRPER